MPTVYLFSVCCVRAASGHATAAPPSAASNARRPMVTVMRPSRARVRKCNDTTPRARCPNCVGPGAGGAARRAPASTNRRPGPRSGVLSRVVCFAPENGALALNSVSIVAFMSCALISSESPVRPSRHRPRLHRSDAPIWRLEEIARERQHQARHDRAADHRRGWFQVLAICKSSIHKPITRLQYGGTRL